MGKKKIGEWTVAKIQKEVKTLIKLGHDAGLIKRIMITEVPEDAIDRELLKNIIQDTIDEHPSYELIQKIQRSKLVVDKNSSEELYYVLDPICDSIDTIHRVRLNGLFLKPDFSERTYVCDFSYAPNRMFRLFKDEQGLWKYNLYQPPEWLKECFNSEGVKKVKKITAIPVLYKKFLEHLVNNDTDSYEYILDWIANAMQDRNYTILTTIGNQGIGKGVLGDIMRKLFGDSNFVKTECRVLTKDFNKQILNKKLVYIDELKIKNSSEENKLKTLINDYVEIEGKGVDAKEVKNFASVYVSSNELDSIRLRGDDRRFSIINLTDKKLMNIMNSNEIESLFDEFNISQLAYYLYHRSVDKNKMMKVFESKRTEEVRASSLKGWEEYVIDELAIDYEGDSVPLTELSDKIEDRYGSRYRPSKAAFKRLEELYPNVIKVIRKRQGDRRIWNVEFSKVSK